MKVHQELGTGTLAGITAFRNPFGSITHIEYWGLGFGVWAASQSLPSLIAGDHGRLTINAPNIES